MGSNKMRLFGAKDEQCLWSVCTKRIIKMEMKYSLDLSGNCYIAIENDPHIVDVPIKDGDLS